MNKLGIFLKRQLNVSKKSVIWNFISAIAVYLVVAFATKKGVCESFEATKSFVFAYVMASVWLGLFNTVCLFSLERGHIIPSLRGRVLSVRTYMGSTMMIQFVQSCVQAIIGTTIATIFDYSREGLVFANSNMDLFITLWLIIVAADAMGFLVSIFIKDIQSALSIVPVILICQMLFSKGIFEVEGWVEHITNFIEARHGIAAMGSILNLNALPMAIRAVYPMVEQEENILFQYEKAYILQCWSSLGLLIIVPLIISAMVLVHTVRKKS